MNPVAPVSATFIAGRPPVLSWSISRFSWSRVGWAGFGPLDHQLALGEQPGAVGLPGELIQIANERHHQGALTTYLVQVMGDAVRLTCGTVPVDHYGALPVEMHRRLIGIQVVEDGRQRLPAVQLLSRLVRAVRVCVEQLSDRQAVPRFLGRHLRVASIQCLPVASLNHGSRVPSGQVTGRHRIPVIDIHYADHVSAGLVDRHDLVAALDRAAQSKVTIISAPAGSGKSSLLRSWADRPGQAHRVVAMTVRPGQHDAQLFWLTLLGAVRSASGAEPPPATPGFNGRAMVDRVRSEL